MPEKYVYLLIKFHRLWRLLITSFIEGIFKCLTWLLMFSRRICILSTSSINWNYDKLADVQQWPKAQPTFGLLHYGSDLWFASVRDIDCVNYLWKQRKVDYWIFSFRIFIKKSRTPNFRKISCRETKSYL